MSTPAQTAWYERNRDRIADDRQGKRLAVLEKYGGRCECCGEPDPRLLTLDHRLGGGNAERAMLRRSGNAFYQRLLDAPRRDDLRVLCWNCNMAQGLYGSCHGEA